MQLSLVRAKLVLTRTKLATRGTANSKEHEVQVTATRRGGRVGRACGTAGPRTSPSDTRENVPSEKTNEHENCHRARPAGWPVGSACGFMSPSDRRTDRPGADREWEPAIRNVPQPPPFRHRSSLSDASSQSGRIPRGVSVKTASCVMIDLCAGTCVSKSTRVEEPIGRSLIASLTARLNYLAIGTAASSG